jgi:hypothetical protein
MVSLDIVSHLHGVHLCLLNMMSTSHEVDAPRSDFPLAPTMHLKQCCVQDFLQPSWIHIDRCSLKHSLPSWP